MKQPFTLKKSSCLIEKSFAQITTSFNKLSSSTLTKGNTYVLLVFLLGFSFHTKAQCNPPSCEINGKNTCDHDTITLCATSGNNYTYYWSTGATTQCIAVSDSGTYTVTVSNNNGCSSTCSKTISNSHTPPDCTISGNTSICSSGCGNNNHGGGCGGYSGNGCNQNNNCGNNNNCNNGHSTGGCGGYSGFGFNNNNNYGFGCNSGGNNCNNSNNNNNNYGFGCNSGGNNCNNSNNNNNNWNNNNNNSGGSTELCAPAGYQNYIWSNGAHSRCITVDQSGTYSVTVTNSSGVSSTCSQTVTVSTPPTCDITWSGSLCSGGVTLCASGGGSYKWNTGDTTQCVTVYNAGEYSVTITNSGGCSSTCIQYVSGGSTPSCDIYSSCGNSMCNGQGIMLCGPSECDRNASFLWSNGATTRCITVSASGTYSLTVTNAGGCSSTCSKTVTVGTPPSCNITQTGSLCTGGVSLCAPSDTGSNYYSWSTGQTSSCITVTTGGTYWLTVTNGGGCSSTCSAHVNNGGNITITPGDSARFCEGGSVELCVHGATAYIWSTGATTSCISVNIAGTFSVSATDSSCSSTASVVVTVASPPICYVQSTGSFCQGGSIQLCAPSGDSLYMWSTGATTRCISVTTSGTYSITTTNTTGCTNTCSKTVTPPTPVSVMCSVTTKTTCDTCCNGVITVIATGGTPPYSYLWSNKDTTQIITGLCQGEYSVIVTDSSGCMDSCKTGISSTVPNCSLSSKITATSPVCVGGNVTLTDTATGATGKVTYSWTGPNGFFGSSPDTTILNVTVSDSGLYMVIVTDSIGCRDTSSATVVVNTLPTTTITGNDTISCNRTSDTLTVSASSGAILNWGIGGSKDSLFVSAGGTYVLTVTGTNGCTATDSVVVAIDTIRPTVTVTGSDTLTCNTTSLTLTASSSLGSTLLWGMGGQTSDSIMVSRGGTYIVTATGANGCTASDSIIVVMDTIPPTATITGNDTISCNRTSDTLTVSASSGATLNWGIGGSKDSLFVSAGGTYVLTVTGTNGCTATDSVVVAIDTIRPTVTVTGSDTLNCTTTSLTLTASSSLGSTLLWGMGGQTSDSIMVSRGGTYIVTAKGANGCTASDSIIVVMDTIPPTATITGNDTISCNRTSDTLTVSASSGATLNWGIGGSKDSLFVSAGGTYVLTVTGTNGCTATDSVVVAIDTIRPTVTVTGSDTLTCTTTSLTLTASSSLGSTLLWGMGGQISDSIMVSRAGTYIVTATGTNGCTASDSIIVVMDTIPPTATIIGNDTISCNRTSDTLTVSASSGTTLNWGIGGSTDSLFVSAGGTYVLTVTGTNGCTATDSVVVAIDTIRPTVTVTGTDTLNCMITSVTLTANVTGGTLKWSVGGQTTDTITVNATGTYLVTATGANGCTATDSIVVVKDTVPATVTISGNQVITCADSVITLTASSSGSTFIWSPGGHTGSSITVTAAGTYTVTATNAYGCTATDTVTVKANSTPPECMVGCSCGDVLCQGKTETICTVSGYKSYVWNTGGTGSCITIDSAGIYTVTITASNGCTTTCSKDVPVSPVPSCSISGLDSICEGQAAELCAPSGEAQYHWNNGALESCITIYTSDTVSVTVTNSSGCSSSCSRYVNVMPLPSCNISGNLVICDGQSTTLTADTGSTSYYWSTGETTRSITTSVIGTYSVTESNADGCSSTCSVCVTLSACSMQSTGITVAAYPNPFSTAATLTFQRTLTSGHTLIEIYNMEGVKVTTLFDRDADRGVVYQVLFDGENIPDGVYIYRITNDDGENVMNGRLSLTK